MPKYRLNCSVCKIAKTNQGLRKRLQHAKFHREDGDEALPDIAREFGFSLPAIYNHCNKHIRDITPGIQQRMINIAEKKKIELQGRIQKELELSLDAKTVEEIESRPAEIVILDDYIAQGAEEIRKGELRITPNSFLAAVKIKTDWASKQQNNKVELLRTIAAFRSGSKTTKEEIIDGTTTEITTSDIPGEAEARDIYFRAFGYAPPQRPTQVPNRNPTPSQEN
jgi:hypothetical protein